MSGTEPVVSTLNTVKVAPPPPRIRPASPLSDIVEISDEEHGSDISSVSSFHDDPQSDKFEAVSDNELLDESFPLRPDDAQQHSSLEDIDSDEDLMPEAESKSENDESLQFFCRPCKLLFIDADGLAAHHHTESHGFVSTGVHPPGGSHSCIVCWVGFQTSEDVDEHCKAAEHKLVFEKHRIVEVNFSPKSDSPNRAKRKQSPGQSPIGNPAKMVRTIAANVDLLNSCLNCNLVFKSDPFYRRHLASQCHASVMSGRSPSVAFSRYDCKKETRPFFCYICWIGFSHLRDLMTHYQRTLHVETLKKNGVVKLVKDIPPPTNPSSKTSPKNGVKIISLKDFIVLDEVGETDDADCQEISVSDFNSFIDELDVISDDDYSETSPNATVDVKFNQGNGISLSGGGKEIENVTYDLPETDLISENGDIFDDNDDDGFGGLDCDNT